METGAGKTINTMLLLYSAHITPRLRYIVEFFSKELFDEPVRITSDIAEFQHSLLPRLNYSDTELAETDFFIRSTSLLFETGIRAQDTECFELNYHKAFFQTEGDLPFDIFAASFYLMSRYEEYLPYEKDEYGRFAHTGSLAFKEGFLHVPLVNTWLQEFKKALLKKYPGLVFRYASFKFIPTYDIDIAWSYLHKGFKRNMGGLVRALVKGQWASIRKRIRVWRRVEKDPFDAYEWLDSLHR